MVPDRPFADTATDPATLPAEEVIPGELLDDLQGELYDPKLWAQVLEKYAATTRLAVALTDSQGHLLGECRNPQPVWLMVKETARNSEGGCPFCLQPPAPCSAVVDALRTGGVVMVWDGAGLAHVAVPLSLGGQRRGALIAGQVFGRYPEPLLLQRVARHYGVSAQQLWHQATQQVPVKQANLGVFANLLMTLGDAYLGKRYAATLQRRLALQSKIATIFLTVPDRSMFGEVVQVILDATQSREGAFSYLDDDGSMVRLSIRRARTGVPVVTETCRLRPDQWVGSWGQALLEKRPVCSNQTGHLSEGRFSVHRMLTVPILFQDEVIGALTSANKVIDYDGADTHLLQRIADYLAPVLKAKLQRDAHEKALSRALAAKQVLLQEVHHRVKNNLQTISSLLNLQAETLPAAALSAFEDARLRVQSMALVHEQLYSRNDPGKLDFEEYATTLITTLFHGLNLKSEVVRLRLELEPVLLGMDQAIPCGLILNELVTNSFKYAFPQSRSGEVLVRLSSRDSGQITLQVADNGIGLPPGFDWEQSTSLGLRIVHLLTHQLNGTLHYKPAGGADFTVTFPAAA